MKKKLCSLYVVSGLMLFGSLSGMLRPEEITLMDCETQVHLRVEELKRLGGDFSEVNRFINGLSCGWDYGPFIDSIIRADEQIRVLTEARARQAIEILNREDVPSHVNAEMDSENEVLCKASTSDAVEEISSGSNENQNVDINDVDNERETPGLLDVIETKSKSSKNAGNTESDKGSESWFENFETWSESEEELVFSQGNDASFEVTEKASIFSIEEDQKQPIALRNIDEDVLSRGRRALLNVGDDEEGNCEVESFISSLNENDRLIFDLLALKPELLSNFLNVDNNVQTEKDIVRMLLGEMYFPLGKLGKVQDCFVNSCLSDVFDPDIFCALVRRMVPQSKNIVEAMIAVSVLNESDINLSRIAKVLDDITNVNEEGVFGEKLLEIGKDGIWLPKLKFPEIELKEQKVQENKERFANSSVIEDYLNRYNREKRKFERTEQELSNEYGQLTWTADMWRALEVEYLQSIADNDFEFGFLRAYINKDPDGLLRQNIIKSFDLDEDEMFEEIETAERYQRRELLEIVSRLSQTKTRLEREKRRLHIDNIDDIDEYVLEKRIFYKVYNAVQSYNKFAKAYRKHVNSKLSSESGDVRIDLNVGYSPKELSLFDQEDINAKNSNFIESKNLFDDWIESFFDPSNGKGMLRLSPFFENSYFVMAGLCDVVGNNQENYDPFFKIYSRYREEFNKINSQLGDALEDFIYKLSFNNMMLNSNNQERPFYEISIENSKRLINDSAYTGIHEIDNISEYEVIPTKEGNRYDLSSILDIIPEDRQARMSNDGDLRKMLSYYFLKGIYVCVTGDKQLNNRYNIRGQLDENGQRYFPRETDNVRGIVFNVLNPIIDNIREEILMNQSMEILSSEKLSALGVLLQSNGDTADYLDGSIMGLNEALNEFKENLSRSVFNITNDRMNESGIYVNKDMVKFIVSQFVSMLDEDNADITPYFFGLLSSRFSHCINGRMEGIMTMFPLMFVNSSLKEGLSFQKVMGICSYISSYSIIKDFINFQYRLDYNESIVPDLEEATYFSYAMGLIGESTSDEPALFGLPGIVEPLQDEFYKWIGINSLKLNCVKNILQIISGDANLQKVRRMYLGEEFFGSTQIERVFAPLFDKNKDVGITSDIQNAIDNIGDEFNKETVRLFSETLVLLKNYNSLFDAEKTYLNLLHNIAKTVVTPINLIRWFMMDPQEQLLKLVFESYKQDKGKFKNVVFENMTKEERRKMLVDVLVDFDWIQLR